MKERISIHKISFEVDRIELPTPDTVVLIVAVTAVVIVVVITARVLTGRGWSNLSKKPKNES